MSGTATGVIDYAGDITESEVEKLRQTEKKAMQGNVGCYMVADPTSEVLRKYMFDKDPL